MNVKLTAIGSILSAFFSSLCCVGPLIFTAIGVGAGATGFLAGLAAYAKALVPYRPLFIGITLVLVTIGLFSAYRKKSHCASDSSCTIESIQRIRIALWVTSGIASSLMLLPYFLTIGG